MPFCRAAINLTAFDTNTSSDIQARSLRDLDDGTNPLPYEKPGDYCADGGNVRHLLEEVIRNEAVIYREGQEELSPADIPRNPIWGFYAYSRVLLRLL